ncbi:GGDEF domain-containing protein [Actinoplanes sp. DH11]|uniref:GGDEF domain-containing protein n=1 Tax=Actinoplanes sp. DH11 TaxID=2857011 RepID=UPI001E58933A|nr:GGDEF domain-containing protein [Actinoplanes sp. DH11]
MTTETVSCVPALEALERSIEELEGRPMSQFRTVRAPAEALERQARELGADELAQRALLLLAAVLLREGRTGEGGQLAHQVRSWAELHDSPYVRARAHRELSIFYRAVGDFSEGLTHAVQGVAVLPDDVPGNVRARHLLSLSVALEEGGSPMDGERRAREALTLAATAGDTELTLLVLNNLAYSAFELDDEPSARLLVGQMREIQQRTGHRFGANELDTMARVELMGGRYAAVEALLQPVLADQVAANEGDAVAECLLTLALARRQNGRYEKAQEALDSARVLCAERELAAVSARVREEQAALFAATGRFAEAYEEHRVFHAEAAALHSAQRDARARALQAVFEANEARRDSEHFREMAHRDPLTGLHNRRYINERVPDLLLDAAAKCLPFSLAIIDLDHFKRVNDTLSHSTGDTVLQHVAELLTEAACGSAFAARMGGEEFLLVYPGVDAAEATERCERLRLRIRAHGWEPITGNLPVTTSVGVTTTPDGRGTFSALLSEADRNLYTAKRDGRDRVVAGLFT